jgi:hypothetical protein
MPPEALGCITMNFLRKLFPTGIWLPRRFLAPLS